MTQIALLERHHQLCDAVHQCVLDENRFLRQHQRAPDPVLTSRKQVLLEQLDESLAALRAEPAASVRDDLARAQLERTRARILQILQLDKENEQLLLRCSLASTHASSAAPAIVPSPSLLQKIYARCS
jgi:hypothetical protein